MIEKFKGWLAYRTVSREDMKRVKKSITSRFPERKMKYKKIRKNNSNLSLIERLQNLFIHSHSEDTEDGIETESDFLCSNSFSETGEEADVEDNFCPSAKRKLRRKTSSSKPCEESTDDESKPAYSYSFTSSPVFNNIPLYCQEFIYEENESVLSGFNQSPPFKEESFEDKGTLADVEDFDKSETSDSEFYSKSQNWFLYSIWN
ncbi:hypothetical protein Anas_03948 [Armadillidium nasatum]|uniref:Uncharacterized protein n=1 Tax=Armadillidium nasatum TaxID=96803 RepID=A0A5N5SI72_9CRUS|nr:hypothetical protein Anas_03948 [Armadillidium nasatum]